MDDQWHVATNQGIVKFFFIFEKCINLQNYTCYTHPIHRHKFNKTIHVVFIALDFSTYNQINPIYLDARKRNPYRLRNTRLDLFERKMICLTTTHVAMISSTEFNCIISI